MKERKYRPKVKASETDEESELMPLLGLSKWNL